jgi:hypothetical protein
MMVWNFINGADMWLLVPYCLVYKFIQLEVPSFHAATSFYPKKT